MCNREASAEKIDTPPPRQLFKCLPSLVNSSGAFDTIFLRCSFLFLTKGFHVTTLITILYSLTDKGLLGQWLFVVDVICVC